MTKKIQSSPKAKKRFSQHFLCDDHVIADIIAAITPQSRQHLVEIGPGQGALTLPLLKAGSQLDVIELDQDMVSLLQQKVSKYQHITIHQADAAVFDYSALAGGDQKLRIIGNLPYHITTPLLFHLLAQKQYIDDMCFMLQHEVIERICAQPGSKAYGRLSIMVQYQCAVTHLFSVSSSAFSPVPKVKSAVIYFNLRDKLLGDVPVKALNKIVTQAFSQRRKTIANTLKKLIFIDDLVADGISPSQRPETISIEQYVMITKRWLANNH